MRAPIRNLGQVGVITDVDPYDLPMGAFSMAVNARFLDGRIQRGPVWRTAGTISADPRFVCVNDTAQGNDDLFIGYLNGRAFKWAGGVSTDYSPAGYVNNTAEAAWSSCQLSDVFYINRLDHVPWYLPPLATQFVSSPTGWDATWRCKVLRSYAGALVALNVTKGGVPYPTLVKTSDIVTDPGVVPGSWNHTDPTTNAVENVLTEMRGQILDGRTMGDVFVIYSDREAWLMHADGSANVYDFRKLRYDIGVINTNCVVDVDGVHYVFGLDDLWAHDGTQKKSIADGRVRKFVFGSMNVSKASKFFVTHNPLLKEIAFCFISGDVNIKFSGNGCNRAAVYNYGSDKWTFDDLPLVFSSTVSTVSISTTTWSSVIGTWSSAGGSWQDFADGDKQLPVYVGEASATYSLSASLYAFDLYGAGSVLNAPVATNATKGVYVARDGIDLDEVGAPLSGYKHVLAVYPQGRVDASGGKYLEFSFGAADFFGAAATFSNYQSYADDDLRYKIDFTDGGRWLSMRFRYDDYRSFSLSGIDLELETTGER